MPTMGDQRADVVAQTRIVRPKREPVVSASPIRMRPHHFLCVLTFAGEGYSRAFIENFRAIVDRIQAGRPIALIAGPDDICAGLCAESDVSHCTNESVTHRDMAARAALEHVAGLASLLAGNETVLNAALVAELRVKFASGEIRSACTGCEWASLCTAIATRSYTGTFL